MSFYIKLVIFAIFVSQSTADHHSKLQSSHQSKILSTLETTESPVEMKKREKHINNDYEDEIIDESICIYPDEYNYYNFEYDFCNMYDIQEDVDLEDSDWMEFVVVN